MKKAVIQIQGVFAELERSLLANRLAKARERKRAETGKCEGENEWNEIAPERKSEILIMRHDLHVGLHPLLLLDLLQPARHGRRGIGKPEGLTENLSGFWSRRIDEANRLAYAVTDQHIAIISCRHHY